MSNESEINRREFLKNGAKSGAAIAALSGITFLTHPERVFGANDRVRVGICGLHGRGWDHVHEYKRIAQAEIAAFCDVDEKVLDQRLGQAEQQLALPKPKRYIDVRKLLEDKDIDAISIATPNHWHSLMAIWGCQAGKDVYVEKPCSHNWWEGRQLVRAAAKYNRIVQHGTQSRSAVGMVEGIRRMQDGLLGDLYLSRGLCYKWRDTIGRAPVQPVPQGVHYDLWTGPAPLKPFTKNRFHYNWHWIWDTGNGDIGNQGIHEMDIARWGLGVGFPNKVSAIGGHFMFDDDQQTPNTLNTAFEYNLPNGRRKMLEFEVRHWITNHEAGIGTPEFESAPLPPAGLEAAARSKKGKATMAPKLGPESGTHNTIGNLFYGSKGCMAMGGYDSYKSWMGKEMTPGPEGHGGEHHFQNFIDCVRSRKAENLNAPIREGHISATLVHLANASYVLGRTLNFDPESEQVIGDDEANRLLRGTYRDPYVVPENV